MPFRAFISADLPSLPGLASLAASLRTASPDLKVVSVEHLHLTLKFLGDTEEGLVPEIVSAIREASAGTPSFNLRLRGTGGFPNLSRPNVLWVGTEGAEPLARIAKSLDGYLTSLGYEAETRPWSAHVTLARVRGRRGLERVRALLDADAATLFGETRIEEIRLKKSVLRPQGPEYTTVEAVRLLG